MTHYLLQKPLLKPKRPLTGVFWLSGLEHHNRDCIVLGWHGPDGRFLVDIPDDVTRAAEEYWERQWRLRNEPTFEKTIEVLLALLLRYEEEKQVVEYELIRATATLSKI